MIYDFWFIWFINDGVYKGLNVRRLRKILWIYCKKWGIWLKLFIYVNRKYFYYCLNLFYWYFLIYYVFYIICNLIGFEFENFEVI